MSPIGTSTECVVTTSKELISIPFEMARVGTLSYVSFAIKMGTSKPNADIILLIRFDKDQPRVTVLTCYHVAGG